MSDENSNAVWTTQTSQTSQNDKTTINQSWNDFVLDFGDNGPWDNDVWKNIILDSQVTDESGDKVQIQDDFEFDMGETNESNTETWEDQYEWIVEENQDVIPSLNEENDDFNIDFDEEKKEKNDEKDDDNDLEGDTIDIVTEEEWTEDNSELNSHVDDENYVELWDNTPQGENLEDNTNNQVNSDVIDLEDNSELNSHVDDENYVELWDNTPQKENLEDNTNNQVNNDIIDLEEDSINPTESSEEILLDEVVDGGMTDDKNSEQWDNSNESYNVKNEDDYIWVNEKSGNEEVVTLSDNINNENWIDDNMEQVVDTTDNTVIKDKEDSKLGEDENLFVEDKISFDNVGEEQPVDDLMEENLVDNNLNQDNDIQETQLDTVDLLKDDWNQVTASIESTDSNIDLIWNFKENWDDQQNIEWNIETDTEESSEHSPLNLSNEIDNHVDDNGIVNLENGTDENLGELNMNFNNNEEEIVKTDNNLVMDGNINQEQIDYEQNGELLSNDVLLEETNDIQNLWNNIPDQVTGTESAIDDNLWKQADLPDISNKIDENDGFTYEQNLPQESVGSSSSILENQSNDAVLPNTVNDSEMAKNSYDSDVVNQKVQSETINQNENNDIQSTLSLDEILDSELLSNPEFADNPISMIKTIKSESEWGASKKKIITAFVWLWVFILMWSVVFLAFPSFNKNISREPEELINSQETSLSETEKHTVAPIEWDITEELLLPEIDTKLEEIEVEEPWSQEIIDTATWLASTIVLFPEVTWEDEWFEDAIPYVSNEINGVENSISDENNIWVDEIKNLIYSLKNQGEWYYSYWQESSDRNIIKYARQIIYLCETYEQKIDNGEWLDNESVEVFNNQVNEKIAKIESEMNGWEENIATIQSVWFDSVFDQRDEIYEYIENR